MNRQDEQLLVAQGEDPATSACIHHWVIETPVGPMSQGVCKRCGEERQFKNFMGSNPYWDHDVSLDQVTSGTRFQALEGLGDSSEEWGE